MKKLVHSSTHTSLKLKDSGTRREFKTGAVRDRGAGKGRYDLIPEEAETAIAMQMEAGALKYKARNWEAGIPLSVYVDSLKRHLNSFMRGYTDEAHHVSMLWNAACLIATMERIKKGKLPKELNDLPNVRL